MKIQISKKIKGIFSMPTTDLNTCNENVLFYVLKPVVVDGNF